MRRASCRFACAVVLAALTTAAAVAATSDDPLLRFEVADQAQAKRVVLGVHDFPSAWRYHPIALRGVSIDAVCTGLNVDLSTLVITGQAGSGGASSSGSLSRRDIVTEAFLFASPAQARTIQARLPTAFIHRCIGRAGTEDGHGGHIDSVSPLGLRAAGVGVLSYRVAVTSGTQTTYGDYLFLRAHRTWVTIFSASTPQPPALDARFIATVAARIR